MNLITIFIHHKFLCTDRQTERKTYSPFISKQLLFSLSTSNFQHCVQWKFWKANLLRFKLQCSWLCWFFLSIQNFVTVNNLKINTGKLRGSIYEMSVELEKNFHAIHQETKKHTPSTSVSQICSSGFFLRGKKNLSHSNTLLSRSRKYTSSSLSTNIKYLTKIN